MNLRSLAKDKPCMIRQPGVCNGDPATTVLCHLRMAGISGMGLKANDFLGAWGCASCHRWCDTNGIDGRTALLEGMARTQSQILSRGLIYHLATQGKDPDEIRYSNRDVVMFVSICLACDSLPEAQRVGDM